MYFKEENAESTEEISFTAPFKVMMVINAILLLVLGVHPDWLIMFL
jgi:NADH:ubiquinone oxidoreductase subunit 2 (subunit N)